MPVKLLYLGSTAPRPVLKGSKCSMWTDYLEFFTEKMFSKLSLLTLTQVNLYIPNLIIFLYNQHAEHYKQWTILSKIRDGHVGWLVDLTWNNQIVFKMYTLTLPFLSITRSAKAQIQ